MRLPWRARHLSASNGMFFVKAVILLHPVTLQADLDCILTVAGQKTVFDTRSSASGACYLRPLGPFLLRRRVINMMYTDSKLFRGLCKRQRAALGGSHALHAATCTLERKSRCCVVTPCEGIVARSRAEAPVRLSHLF